MSAKSYNSTEICLAFKDFSVSKVVPPAPVIGNVSGFVAKGGITAVFGASSSGKSLLLQALSGRVRNRVITGDVFLNGLRVDPSSNQNSVSYVSQDTMLIGDLTAKEMITNAACMKTKKPRKYIDQHVDEILKAFGLDHVADTFIGTIFRSGLSGGQKRRVDVAVELVSAPSLLLLDEPTSGLDGSIAFEVLSAIRTAVKSRPSNNALSVMLSIHQPNSRILELFDHILVLGSGGMAFFGTVAESVQHFTRIGFAPPEKYTPTDFYLNAIDTNFNKNRFDFVGAFSSSEKYLDLIELVEFVESRGQMERLMQNLGTNGAEGPRSLQAVGVTADDEGVDNSLNPAQAELARKTSMLTQMSVLMRRDFTIAARDPTLYYLQVALVLMFGFLIGAVFFDLKYRIDETMMYIPSGLLWIVLMTVYIQIFKVYHTSKANQRFTHEYSNGAYTVAAYFWAELLTVSTLLVFYLPGAAVAYFMMGLPGRAFPFIMLQMWMTAVAADSLLLFITKFFKDISAAVVSCQLVLVLLTAFGSGLFIRWADVPAYWEWLQALSLFNHASRGAMLSVMRKLTYQCHLAGDGLCYGPSGEHFACMAGTVGNGLCDVSGSTVLLVTQNVPLDESYWKSFGYVVALFVGFRLAVAMLMCCPFDKIVFSLQKTISSPHLLLEVVLSHLKIQQLEQRVARLIHNEHEYTALPTSTQRGRMSENPVAAPKDTPAIAADEKLQAGAHAQAARLSWSNLDLVLKKGGKKLIDNASGCVAAGKILALMGPSGAGKTTLLNALANRAPYAHVTGEVKFGGTPLTSRDLMYVPQFDEVKGYTTVVEQIELVGLMKCSDRLAMRRRLLKLLQILGLLERANTLCKDLTGGEQKRLSVGMGMISSPKVLFLDEPTTGLDSTAAYYLVKYLVDLARDLQLPVIMTIHQPAAIVFDMLPDLYLLEGGRLAFFGSIATAERYFSDLGHACPAGVNPADFYLDLVYKAPPASSGHATWREIFLSTDHGRTVFAHLEKDAEAERQAVGVVRQYDEPSLLLRFWYLTAFFARYFAVNPGYYVYRLVYLVLCAVYIGTLYLDLNTNTSELIKYSGSIFFSIWATLFAAVGGTGLVASDRRQAAEQIKNGVITPSISCAAPFIASLPYNCVCAFAFQLLFHWISHINPSGESFIYAVILTMLHMLMMEAIMAIVVEIVRDAMLAVTSAMVVMGTLFLFPGFFIQVSSMPVWISWISYIVPTKYSFDGYLRIIFYTQDFDVLNTGYVVSGRDILVQLYNNKDVNAWGMIGVLLAYIALFRLVHYGLFLYASWPFLTAPPATSGGPGKGAEQTRAYGKIGDMEKSEVELV